MGEKGERKTEERGDFGHMSHQIIQPYYPQIISKVNKLSKCLSLSGFVCMCVCIGCGAGQDVVQGLGFVPGLTWYGIEAV